MVLSIDRVGDALGLGLGLEQRSVLGMALERGQDQGQGENY